MSKARLVITAVNVEKRPVSEVAKSYGIARSWVCALLDRYRAEGEAAFEPRSRWPKTSPTAISDDAADLIIQLRKELSGQGLDAGPQTIAWHLQHRVEVPAATVSRYLSRAGLVTPNPAKRPKSSCTRFEAAMPNECWQPDFTHYPLADGTDTKLLDRFAVVYNERRPHRSLPGRATPAAAYAARPKAVPGDRTADTHDRVRTDRIDATGL